MSKSNHELQFRVHSLRTLSSPYSRTDKEESTFETLYYLLVDMRDLPANIPLDVNPRKPKMSTSVAKSLKNAVAEPETDFYLNNRGIVISAKSLIFETSKSQVTIDLGDQSDEGDKGLYGILDGGHTYTAVISERSKIPNDVEKYVRVEVITNVQNISRLSDARNTSLQVSDIALFNLDDKFEDIKTSIQDEPYASRIAYKDNDDKEINVSELLRLMYTYDIEKYPDDSVAPVQSYSGKAQVFKQYKESFNSPLYKSLTKQIPTLVGLYDLLERELPKKYSDYKLAAGITRPQFGKVRGIDGGADSKSFTTLFLQNVIDYRISTGYIYPIFGAFRNLLEYDANTQEVYWVFPPEEIWAAIGTNLVQNTFESSNNPQLAGKDKQLWLSNYRIVETQKLRKLLNESKH